MRGRYLDKESKKISYKAQDKDIRLGLSQLDHGYSKLYSSLPQGDEQLIIPYRVR